MTTRALACLVLLNAIGLACVGSLHAQCPPDHPLLVGEDEYFWYCGSGAEFDWFPYKLQRALDSAAESVNPQKSLDPEREDKNCSSFFRAVGRELGASSPEWTEPLDANEIATVIESSPGVWVKVTGTDEEVTEKVQSLANKGAIAVGVRHGSFHGHVAIASPLPPGVRLDNFCCEGPMVRDGNVHLSQERKKPSGWGAVRAGYAFHDYGGRPPSWYVLWTSLH